MFKDKLSPAWQSYCWWESKRFTYNKGLILSGFVAFMLYQILGEFIIAPHEEFEETIFEMTFQSGLYFIMMLIANVCYYLGWIIDVSFNKDEDEKFRKNLYALGYWLSFSLPIGLIVYIMAWHYFKYL